MLTGSAGRQSGHNSLRVRPPPREIMPRLCTTQNNVMIVYGGEVSGGAFPGDVWTLSNANGLGGTPAWTQLAPSGAPAARAGQSAIYDTANNRMTIFGGATNSGLLLNDVWALSSADGLGGKT